jgi:hypothetical protein
MKGMTRKEFLNLAGKFNFSIRTWDKARETEMFVENKEGHKLLIARYHEIEMWSPFLRRTANEGEAIGWGLFPGYKRNNKDELVVYDLQAYAKCEEFKTSEDFVDFLHKQLKVIADFNKEIKKQELIESSKLYEI